MDARLARIAYDQETFAYLLQVKFNFLRRPLIVIMIIRKSQLKESK